MPRSAIRGRYFRPLPAQPPPDFNGYLRAVAEIKHNLPRSLLNSKLCLSCGELFVAQRDYRIDAHGFTGRRVASNQSDCPHEKTNDRKGGHVARAHAIN